MHFLRVQVTFYDAVKVIRDVITTANPIFHILLNSCLSELRIIKLNQSDVYSVAVYQNNSFRGNDNFLAKALELSVLPTSLDIFAIRQHYILIFYLSMYEVPS